MSKTLSRKQIQKMRRLSNAKFPMLGVVAVAALFVIRVPVIQSWESHADAGKARQTNKVGNAAPGQPASPTVDQVAVGNSPENSGSDTTVTDTEANDQQDGVVENWFDLLSHFEPRNRNDGFPQNDAADDAAADDDSLVDDLDDLDLRHVSQVGPETDNVPEQDEPVLRLLNPAGNGGIVYFVVDQDTHSIDVGQTLELSGKKQWLVMFHRGGDFGNSRRVLKPGSYSFSVSERGWTLK